MPCTTEPVYSYPSNEKYYAVVTRLNEATRAYCELLL